MWTIEDKLRYQLDFEDLPDSTYDTMREALECFKNDHERYLSLYELYSKTEEKIDVLKKKIKDLKKKTEWISVKERFPKKTCEYYLVIYKGKVEYAYFQVGGFRLDDVYGYIEPTHWMPLPKAPKITKKKEKT